MHNDDDDDDRDLPEDDEDDDEDDHDEDDDDYVPTFARDDFSLTGMECLDEDCIMAASFRRTLQGNFLEVQYAIGPHNQDIISAPFSRFCSTEAYLLLTDEGEPQSTIIMSDLVLTELDLRVDEDAVEGESMYVFLKYTFESFQHKLEKKEES